MPSLPVFPCLQVLSITKGAGVDLVVEMAAHTNLGSDLKMLKAGGRVVIVGSRGDVTISPRDIMAKESVVTGVMLFAAKPEGLRCLLSCGLKCLPGISQFSSWRPVHLRCMTLQFSVRVGIIYLSVVFCRGSCHKSWHIRAVFGWTWPPHSRPNVQGFTACACSSY